VKNLLENINKSFENRVRLGVMSILMVNESVDFNFLKEALDLTDGNLASHVSALEKAEYIEVRKSFVGKKPNTTYSATDAGRKAFTEHLEALEALIRSNNR
jgi:DNA-binding MarR family transcriptional regulator